MTSTPRASRPDPTRRGPIGRSTDPRSERSRQTVLAATLALLEQGGVGGFSVDEVARRSGVAKTTIYRHWPTREALVLDACARLGAEQDVPDTGTLAGDLRAHLAAIAELLQTANWSAVLPSIVDAAERDAEFASVHGEIQRGHAGPVHEIVARAIGRGELPAAADASTVAALVLGPLFYRRWFSREPLHPAFVETVVSRTIAAVYV